MYLADHRIGLDCSPIGLSNQIRSDLRTELGRYILIRLRWDADLRVQRNLMPPLRQGCPIGRFVGGIQEVNPEPFWDSSSDKAAKLFCESLEHRASSIREILLAREATNFHVGRMLSRTGASTTSRIQ